LSQECDILAKSGGILGKSEICKRFVSIAWGESCEFMVILLRMLAVIWQFAERNLTNSSADISDLLKQTTIQANTSC
jgi:hypothetical protein